MELEEWTKEENLLQEWGVVFISSESDVLPYAYSLIEPFSNNVAE